jgi:hypothetical protein
MKLFEKALIEQSIDICSMAGTSSTIRNERSIEEIICNDKLL